MTISFITYTLKSPPPMIKVKIINALNGQLGAPFIFWACTIIKVVVLEIDTLSLHPFLIRYETQN